MGDESEMPSGVGPPVSTLTTCGPFLRYQNILPGTNNWTGSVLFVTRTGGAAGGAAPDAGAAAAAGPTLTMIDSFRDGDVAVASNEQWQLSPTQLDECEGWVFWRYELALPLTPFQRAVQYRIASPGGDNGKTATPTYTFWLPAIGQPMHWGYHSCNGFSSNVPADAPERQDATYLWRDLLAVHSAFPMHCLVGGGDQLYCDCVFTDPLCKELRKWGVKDAHTAKTKAEWTAGMQSESTHNYLFNYLSCFSTPDIQMAFASIPQVMMWDDHDIWDGWGSYEPDMQTCKVFKGLFAVARRFYLLFQQHTTDAFNAKAKEYMGPNDGAVFHSLKYMGPQVVLLAIDMRSQRSKARIMPQSSYDMLEKAVMEVEQGPQHIVILCGCPLVFPAIPAAEGILQGLAGLAKKSAIVRRIFRTSGLMDRFDQPEILDDLVDGWAADVHTEERVQFVRMLQRFSLQKNMRVSILSGDAHVGGVGRLYSRDKNVKTLEEDPLFMPQIISSAIMNGPPPHPVVKMLLRTNFAANLDDKTRQKMVRIFPRRLHPRTDKLVGARNWCDISLAAPPFSPPTVPSDPNFGGLRFCLRVEDAKHRKGQAEETYTILVPRHPNASESTVATGAPTSIAGLPVPEPSSTNGHKVPHPLNLVMSLVLPGARGSNGAAGGGKPEVVVTTVK